MPSKVWWWNYLSIHNLQHLHHWSLGMDKLLHPIHYYGCNYLSMLGLKLNHVSKMGYGWPCICFPGVLIISGDTMNEQDWQAPYLGTVITKVLDFYLSQRRWQSAWEKQTWQPFYQKGHVFLFSFCKLKECYHCEKINLPVAKNHCRADSRLVHSQWETALLCNDVSHWLGASLDSALQWIIDFLTTSLIIFLPKLRFIANFILLSFILWWCDGYKILHVTQR